MTKLICMGCGQSYTPEHDADTCHRCGRDRGILDVQYDLATAKKTMTWENLANRPQTHWRYRELVPVDHPPDWPVGFTPIIPAPRLAKEIGVRELRIKDDGRNATASFKDRASSVAVARALAASAKTIACASTGNAASSLAGWSAVAGIPAVIFVPKHAPEPKIAQLLIYGATVFRVQGTYAQAYELCNQACATFGWYNRNCAINPYLVEGKKTGGLEIAEQCKDTPPDWVVLSVGDGCTIAGTAKGLRQMRELGLIDWKCQVLGVQSANVNPISRTFRNEPCEPAEFKPTVADSIDVAVPRNLHKAIHEVRASNGTFVEVRDQEILAAIRSTGRLAGVFSEPAAAASVAGLAVAVAKGIVPPNASVVVVSTGSGLKDIKSAMTAAGAPIDIPPDLNAVRRICEE